MEVKKTIALEKQDIKKLKRKKLFQLIFFIYMDLVTCGIIGFSYWLYNYEREQEVAMFMGIAALLSGFVVFVLYRSWENLGKDLKAGTKEVINGQITRKHSHKNRYELTIEGKDYLVNYDQYKQFKKGQQVLIGYSPNSKIVHDMHDLSAQSD